ncbi:NUDIX hydrolase [Larsenimonas salina]|uniref:NUDIX hydrolase n=1 Tax=Larsenimonas salina TaxID=1295565 RepID=UPI0020741FC1|nr:NUDIX hydrolase [Larsenimonas salina]MCM5704962.1 NUDIX hydrolase [Larsenimonas salina]
MNYCSHCGASVSFEVPSGDDRPRYLCHHCGTVHYQNPRIVAGTIPVYEGKVLLCRRAIEPRHGYWTLPAGYMENGETTEQAAWRETWEEAQADVKVGHLYTLIDLPHINQVYMIFRAEAGPDFAAGPESLEVALFDEQDIPWDHLAFPTIVRTLEHFFEDRPTGKFPLHTSTMDKRDRKGMF